MTTPTPDELARLARGMTKAQIEMLLSGGRCVEVYKPEKKLLALGLASERRGRFGGYWLDWTPLGLALRDWIKENSNG